MTDPLVRQKLSMTSMTRVVMTPEFLARPADTVVMTMAVVDMTTAMAIIKVALSWWPYPALQKSTWLTQSVVLGSSFKQTADKVGDIIYPREKVPESSRHSGYEHDSSDRDAYGRGSDQQREGRYGEDESHNKHGTGLPLVPHFPTDIRSNIYSRIHG